jgi:hypothetical protein
MNNKFHDLMFAPSDDDYQNPHDGPSDSRAHMGFPLDAFRVRSEIQTRGSVLALLRMRYEAWWTETASAAELRILDQQEQVITRRAVLAEAEFNARTRVIAAAVSAADQESEFALRMQLREASITDRFLILGAEVETQRLLAEREYLCGIRANKALPPPPHIPAPAPRANLPCLPTGGRPFPALPERDPHVDPLKPEEIGEFELHVSDRQIDRLALKAVTRFQHLPRQEAQRAWASWEEELHRRLPMNTAAEVVQRARELQSVMEEK